MLLGVWNFVITVWLRPVSRPGNLNKVLNKVNKVKESKYSKRSTAGRGEPKRSDSIIRT